MVSCKPVYVQRKGKYASKEEYSEGKERMKEKRRVIMGILRNYEK